MQLAAEAPFAVLRSQFKEFLLTQNCCNEADLADVEFVSHFIPLDFVPPLVEVKRWTDDQSALRNECFEEAFFLFGRVPHYQRLMACFPDYWRRHLTLFVKVMQDPGPLPVSWRHYLAFLAAAAHSCEYLMKQHEHLSINYGGSSEWFRPSRQFSLPGKLRAFANANLKLAHQPWEFGVDDVKELLRSCSIQEIVFGLIILSEFHALSSFVIGVGVASEFDQPCKGSRKISVASLELVSKDSMSLASRLRNYEDAMRLEIEETPETIEYEEEDRYFESFVGGRLPYVNFEMSRFRRPVYPSDFTWRDHGLAVLDRLCPTIADLIADTIHYAATMTSRTFSDEMDINTEPFRRAIWKYTHRVYGLAYDDYNYQEVNVFLLIGLKKYLKKVTCIPHTLTRDDFDGIDVTLKPHEIVHVNILVAEARVEAQLLYAVAAIEQSFKV
mmetsp:Transcript_13143/g.24613  ORF Transcript_13143/g.24613 Transcript_13143/m.24613 type:complete len:442 (-) Transcript_13143:103-1428(-)